MTARLRLVSITKTYPGVRANDDVSLSVDPGKVLAVLGENGAGKSTLMRIIYGAEHPDSGTIEFDGKPVDIASPSMARRLGIAMVHQHFALFETLTVAQNVQLGSDLKQTLAETVREVRETGERYGLSVDPDAFVADLSMGERQRVEIIRALMTKPRLLIMDEPTSVLTPQAVKKLFETLRKLASEGVSILFISHKLDEIRDLADRGEIIGIAGISGNGQSRLLGVLSGELKPSAGSVRLFGKDVTGEAPAARRRMGLRYVPEERLGHGAVPELSLESNALLTGDGFHHGGFIRTEAVKSFAREVVEKFRVATPSIRKEAGALSGGNLQKFIVGREILNTPGVLMIDQPTWGVDVGAAAVIHNALLKLRAEGAGLLVVSEEIDELFAVCDRIAVMYRGYLSPAVPVTSITIEEIGLWMAGLWAGSPFRHPAADTVIHEA